jgi:flagellar P-ring protein precursor FlgI
MWTLLLALCAPASAAPLRDVADLYGVRTNALQGVGVVVGLNRTGDSAQNPAAVEAMVKAMGSLGFTVSADDVKSRNVAMVMVAAELPPNAMPGMRLDVRVSSTGDARSLEGGSLLYTTLNAVDGQIYAGAVGSIVIGGYSVTSGGESVTKNHPTVGIITDGATVEAELPARYRVHYDEMLSFKWMLHESDFANAAATARAINAAIPCECAHASDSRVVDVTVPDGYLGNQIEFVAAVEQVDVTIIAPARVVVNERTGAVVMGSGIVVHPVAVTLGGLTIEVKKAKAVSQPNALARGDTTVVEDTDVTVNESDGKLTELRGGTVGEIVNSLNDMGVSPRECIVLLQMMKAAGAIDAPIVSM